MQRFLIFLTALALALAGPGSDTNTYYPAVVRNADDFLYIGFGPMFYSFNLPYLSLAKAVNMPNVNFSGPATFDGRYVTFANDNGGSYKLDTYNDYAFSNSADNQSPQYPQAYADTTFTTNGVTYQLNSVQGGATNSYISRTDAAGQTITAALDKPFNEARKFFVEGNNLYAVIAVGQGRGSSDFDFYSLDATTLARQITPVTLPNSEISGCPVPARGCGVPVLGYIDVVNTNPFYVYTFAHENSFEVTVTSYTTTCGFSTNKFDDEGEEPSQTGSTNCQPAPAPSSTTSAATPSSTTSTPVAGSGDATPITHEAAPTEAASSGSDDSSSSGSDDSSSSSGSAASSTSGSASSGSASTGSSASSTSGASTSNGSDGSSTGSTGSSASSGSTPTNNRNQDAATSSAGSLVFSAAAVVAAVALML